MDYGLLPGTGAINQGQFLFLLLVLYGRGLDLNWKVLKTIVRRKKGKKKKKKKYMVFSSCPIGQKKSAILVIFAFSLYNSRWSSPFTSFRSPLMPAVLQILAL